MRKDPPAPPSAPPAARGRLSRRMAAAAAQGQLALQHCLDCARTQYPPRELCGDCLSARLAWRSSADMTGEVLAETVLHHSNEPYFRRFLPLRVGLVRLACGGNAVSFLEAACAPGATVRVRARLDASGGAVLVATPA